MAGAPSYINRSPVVDYRQNKALVRRPVISAHNTVPSRISKPLGFSSGSEGFSRLSVLQHLAFFGVGAGAMEALYQTRTATHPEVQARMEAKDGFSKAVHEYGIPMGIGGGAGIAVSLLISGVVRLIRGPQAKPETQAPVQEVHFSIPAAEPQAPAASPAPVRTPSLPSIVTQLPDVSMTETWERDLPEYQMVRMLGRGGQGEAILAQRVVGERVVIKRLNTDALGDKTAKDRFLQEALTLKDIVHPNVVRFLEFRMKPDAYYFMMEFIDGQNLSEMLKAGKTFETNEALSIIYRAVLGLQHVWETAKIVHRDVKLHNIMVMAAEPFVKVIDFGLAKGEKSNDLTQTGLLACSPRYVAPERVEAMRDPRVVIDQRADEYSLGMTLYYMLAGKETFSNHEHIYQELPDIRTINPAVPDKVWNLILRMTAKNRDQRHTDYSELLKEIAYCLQ